MFTRVRGVINSSEPLASARKLLQVHSLLNAALHFPQTTSKFSRHKVGNRTNTTVTQVVDIIDFCFTRTKFTMWLNTFNKSFGRNSTTSSAISSLNLRFKSETTYITKVVVNGFKKRSSIKSFALSKLLGVLGRKRE